MKTPPKAAVILAAGKGTRRLPVTRAIDKAMLPIGNRPVVDYVVEQAVVAGITRLVFVISEPDSLIKKYYTGSFSTVQEYPWLNIDKVVACEYIIQPSNGRYGTAAALDCAKDAVKKENSFIMVPADGFIYSNPPDAMKSIVEEYVQDKDAVAVLGGLKTTSAEASLYSTIDYREDGSLMRLNEKPKDLDPTQEYLSNVSYYVFEPAIFDYISHLTPVNGEYLLTDTVSELAISHNVSVVPVEGKYLDSGQLEAWVQSNIFMLKVQR